MLDRCDQRRDGPVFGHETRPGNDAVGAVAADVALTVNLCGHSKRRTGGKCGAHAPSNAVHEFKAIRIAALDVTGSRRELGRTTTKLAAQDPVDVEVGFAG